MATVTIKRLVGKTNGSGLTSWYWQPSASLRTKGWHPRALGSGGSLDAIPDEIAEQARKLNLDVDGSAELPLRELRRVQRPLTVDELIRRYQAAGFPSVRKSRQGRPVAPATQRQYRSKCRTLSAWGKGVALSSVTPERVVVLRDALMAAVDDGSEDGRVRHHAAHETLRVARTLFTWAEQQRLVPKGSNPFEDFGLAAPEPRDQIWWEPTREALLAQAAAPATVGVDGPATKSAVVGRPDEALVLAIDLAFSIGQREADLLQLSLSQYAEIPHYKMDPEVYAQLAEPDASGRNCVMGIRIRQNKGKRWIEVPVVGQTRRRIEAQVAAAKAAGVTLLLFDGSTGLPWTHPNPEAGQRRFIRDFAELRSAAIRRARVGEDGRAPDETLATELEQLQFRDFRRTAVVFLGELGIADHLIAAITGHSLDETKRILDTYMPRTTGMAARAIALSRARSPQSGTLGRAGETK